MANIDSLVEVIRVNLEKGVPAEKLVESAKAAGWSDEDIDSAFAQVKQPAVKKQEKALETATVPMESAGPTAAAVVPAEQQTQEQENAPRSFREFLMSIVLHPKAELENKAKQDYAITKSLKTLAKQGALSGVFIAIGMLYLLIALALLSPDALIAFSILAISDITSGIVTLVAITLALIIGFAVALPIFELINNAGTYIVSKIAGGRGSFAKQLQLTSHSAWIGVALLAILVIPFIGLAAAAILLLPMAILRMYALIRAVQYAHDFSGRKATLVIIAPLVLIALLEIIAIAVL